MKYKQLLDQFSQRAWRWPNKGRNMSPWQYTIFIVYKIKCCVIDRQVVFRDMLTTNNPVDSSPAISAVLPSSPLGTSPQHPSPAAKPPSPVWVCPAGYAIPPVADCACMQDGVHAHHPDSAGTCMQTDEPEDWHKKHKNVLSKLSQRRNSSSSRITILQSIAHKKFQSQNCRK